MWLGFIIYVSMLLFIFILNFQDFMSAFRMPFRGKDTSPTPKPNPQPKQSDIDNVLAWVQERLDLSDDPELLNKAKNGDKAAIELLGNIASDIYFNSSHDEKEFKHFVIRTVLGEAGCAVSQYNVGIHYEKGEAVQKDLSEAEKWYHKSANNGNAAAQLTMGALEQMTLKNADGIAGARKIKSTINWYTKALNNPNADAEAKAMAKKAITNIQRHPLYSEYVSLQKMGLI